MNELTELEIKAGIGICPKHGKYLVGEGCRPCIIEGKIRIREARDNVLLSLQELYYVQKFFMDLDDGNETEKLLRQLEKKYGNTAMEIKNRIINDSFVKPKTVIKFKKQDQWIGRYYDDKYNYICLLPCLPICIPRG